MQTVEFAGIPFAHEPSGLWEVGCILNGALEDQKFLS